MKKAAALVFLENLIIEFFFVFIGANIVRLIRSLNCRDQDQEKTRPIIPVVCVLLAVVIGLISNMLQGSENNTGPGWDAPQNAAEVPADANDAEHSGNVSEDPDHKTEEQMEPSKVNDGFILIEDF